MSRRINYDQIRCIRTKSYSKIVEKGFFSSHTRWYPSNGQGCIQLKIFPWDAEDRARQETYTYMRQTTGMKKSNAVLRTIIENYTVLGI